MSDTTDGAEPPPRRSRGRHAAWIAGSVGIVMVLLIVVLATRKPALNKQTPSPLVGRAAPALNASSVTSSEFRSLDDLRGRWVVVNFFATWCVPCRVEHPEFVRFVDRHPGETDVQLMMVVFQDSVANVRDFFAHNGGGNWPVVEDRDGAVSVSFGVAKVPETYLIAPNGIVVAKISGGLTADGLDAFLSRARGAGVQG